MSNLKKMAEKGDFDGLANILKTDKFQNRLKAMEIMMEMDDPIAKEALKKAFTYIFEYGNIIDKIEAITIMQGHSPSMFGIDCALSRCNQEIPWDRKKSFYNIEKTKFKKKIDLDIAKSILLELAKDSSENAVIRWYATIALIEIGERSNDTLQLLFDTFPKVITMLNADITIRAFSYFNNPEVIDFLIKIIKGEIDLLPTDAIFALAATGEPKAKEYLEFYASNKTMNKNLRKYSEKALKFYGENYDIIRSKST